MFYNNMHAHKVKELSCYYPYLLSASIFVYKQLKVSDKLSLCARILEVADWVEINSESFLILKDLNWWVYAAFMINKENLLKNLSKPFFLFR